MPTVEDPRKSAKPRRLPRPCDLTSCRVAPNSKRQSPMSPNKNNTLLSLIALLSGLLGPAAHAAIEDGDSALTVTGFGTVSMLRTDSGPAIFIPYGNQASGAQTRWVGNLDTMAAVQARYRFLPSAAATLQLTARRDADNNYVPDIDWAYLDIQPEAGLDFRLGRFVAPLFAASDTRMVGYANLWVRPPLEVYTLGISGVDGADAIWRQAIGHSALSTQIWGGKTRQRFPRNSAGGQLTNQAVEYDQMLGLNLTLQRGGLGLRLAHMRARQTLITTRGSPEAGLSIFGSSQSACMPKAALTQTTLLCRDVYLDFARLEHNYDVNEAVFRFNSVGLNYEHGPWRLIAEGVSLQHQSRIANSKAAYLSLAYSIGKFTPYVTLAWHQAETKTFEARVKPEYESLVKPTLKSYRPAGSAGPRQEGQSIGVRWDAWPGLALKLQIDRMHALGDGNGISDVNRIGLAGKNLSDGPAIHVYNLSADFAF